MRKQTIRLLFLISVLLDPLFVLAEGPDGRDVYLKDTPTNVLVDAPELIESFERLFGGRTITYTKIPVLNDSGQCLLKHVPEGAVAVFSPKAKPVSPKIGDRLELARAVWKLKANEDGKLSLLAAAQFNIAGTDGTATEDKVFFFQEFSEWKRQWGFDHDTYWNPLLDYFSGKGSAPSGWYGLLAELPQYRTFQINRAGIWIGPEGLARIEDFDFKPQADWSLTGNVLKINAEKITGEKVVRRFLIHSTGFLKDVDSDGTINYQVYETLK